MTKALLILLLAASAQAACPSHPNRILDNQAALPGELLPICGPAFDAYRGSFGAATAVRWTELYTIRRAADPRALAGALTGVFQTLGFTLKSRAAVSPTARAYQYVNVKTQRNVSMYTTVINQIPYLSLTGN